MGVHGGALGRATDDQAVLRRAADVLAESPYRWHAARARLDLGSHLRRAGQRTEAREHLQAALEYFEGNGVRHLGERAREELKVSGARLRSDVHHSGVDALTPAELRIARLAADGMSNKEIAQHLFVTVGTVQTTLVRATGSWTSVAPRVPAALAAIGRRSKTYGAIGAMDPGLG